MFDNYTFYFILYILLLSISIILIYMSFFRDKLKLENEEGIVKNFLAMLYYSITKPVSYSLRSLFNIIPQQIFIIKKSENFSTSNWYLYLTKFNKTLSLRLKK